MPERNLFGATDSHSRTLIPREWTQVTFNRRFHGGSWSVMDPAVTVLSGRRRWTGNFAVRLNGVEKGTTAQLRFGLYRQEGGSWKRVGSTRADTIVAGSANPHLTYSWATDTSDAVRCEVRVIRDEPVHIDHPRAEIMWWPL